MNDTLRTESRNRDSRLDRMPSAPRRPPVARPLAHELIVVAPAILIFAQLTALGANSAPISALAALAEMGLALATLLVLRPEHGFWRAVGPVLALMVAALLWASAPALLPLDSVRLVPDVLPLELTKLGGVIACVLLGALIGAKRGMARRSINATIGLAALWILFSLILNRIDSTHVWGQSKGLQVARFTATLLNANAAACALVVVSTLTIGRLIAGLREAAREGWPDNAWLQLTALILITLLALGATILTRSRAALILGGVAIALLGAGAVAGHAGRARLFLGAIVAGIIAASAGLLLAVGNPLLLKFLSLGDDAVLRMIGIARYTHLSLVNPWFGTGLGSFRDLNLATLDPTTADMFWTFGAAHCAPVQAALEGGWPFSILLLGAIAAGGWRVLRSVFKTGFDPLDWSLVLAVVIIFASSMIDIALNVPVLAAMASLLGGMALGRATLRERAAAALRRPPPAP